MPEEIKDKILNFLISNPDKSFSAKQISKILEISYPTILKWISVLEAEGKIEVLDFGNVKIIKVKR
jgi:predicted AAA+ superfamily ATPase